MYGVDWEGPLSLDDDEDAVVIPECVCPLTDVQFDELCTVVSPLSSSTNYGIDLYQSVLEFVAAQRGT